MIWLIALLAITIILAVLANSLEESKRDAISADFSHERPLASAVGLGAIGSRLPDHDSVVIGSYTTSGDEIISVGLLGMVVDVEIEPDG